MLTHPPLDGSQPNPIRWVDNSLAAHERATSEQRNAVAVGPSFGTAMSEHMVSLRWSPELGWYGGEIGPYQSLQLDPATVGLHYGQSIFEGLKAVRRVDGVPSLFRVKEHARRFQNSAARLAMPQLPVRDFVAAMTRLVAVDERWVPYEKGRSLYLRPLLFAADASLALRPSVTYRFVTIAFVADNIFGSTSAPVAVWASPDSIRSAPGGTGAVKCGGNYAPTYLAQEQAIERGCQQVVWLDSDERRWVEELGAMNIFWVRNDAHGRFTLVTPPLTGTLLPGITRQSIIAIARDLGIPCAEERVSLAQWREEAETGTITESFACGTAAVLTPIGRVVTPDGGWAAGNGTNYMCSQLRDAFTDIQRGARPSPGNWLTPIQ